MRGPWERTASIVVVEGQDSWGAHESGHVAIPGKDDAQVLLPIAYDEREAPYVPEDQTLVSLADEGNRCVCAWTHARNDSGLLGLGVDLASAEDFADRPDFRRFLELMFSKREHELAQRICADDLAFAYAVLFGAKEAAFKATARPLRQWYASHVEALEYEVRDFGMTELGMERGELRHGAAQVALDRMGIEHIDIHFKRIDNMALVLAFAYGELGARP